MTSPAHAHTPILATRNLSIGYRHGLPVREHIEVDLTPGTLTCLVGRNGAGKSTLLRTLCGFLPPKAGHVELLGRPLQEYSQRQLSRTLGVVLTEILGEIHYLTVRQTVETGRYPYCDCFARLDAQDRQEVEQAMRTVGIAPLAERTMARISDGQRQKVMIAKALAQDTELIVLDEPLSFLDLSARVEIMSVLQRLAHENGKTLLLSTHDLDLAFAFADRMWIMDTSGGVGQCDAPWEDKAAIADRVFGEQSVWIKDFLKI